MGQQRTLVYSFVARDTSVLADHAEVSGNFASVAAQCLQKLPASNNRFTYNCDGHTFNYHVHDGFSDGDWRDGQQRTLAYSFVARGTTVLADHAEVSGNFASVAAQCLQKLPASNNRFTYNCDFHTNYHVHDRYTYCVVATESAGRQLPIGFIERVKEDFAKKYSGGKARSATANSLKREYGPKLKEHMRYCDQHPEEIDKLAKVKAQVTEVKGVMMQNIEKVLDRGEKIELLVDKTEDLRSQAQDFRKQGTKIRRKMWWENMKIKLIVFGIVVALILLVVLTVCRDFNCW